MGVQKTMAAHVRTAEGARDRTGKVGSSADGERRR